MSQRDIISYRSWKLEKPGTMLTLQTSLRFGRTRIAVSSILGQIAAAFCNK